MSNQIDQVKSPTQAEHACEREMCATVWGVDRTTGARWHNEGRIKPSFTVNRRRYYPRDTRPLSDHELATRQQGDAA